MPFPDFFAQIPSLRLRDPLADTLGAATDGIIEYHYADAVKLAGHSCPTLAGAWLMISRALTALYPDSLPLRGDIRVELRGAQDVGTIGVVGAVLGLITGAAGEGGFKGLGGKHVRRDLLKFGADIDAEARITRLDNGASVLLDYHPEAVPPAPEMPALMARVVGGVATAEERTTFGQLWQDRVRRILLQSAEQPTIVLRAT
jgi:hypothetical protein